MNKAYEEAAKAAEEEKAGLLAQRGKHLGKVAEIDKRLGQIQAVIELAAGAERKPAGKRKKKEAPEADPEAPAAPGSPLGAMAKVLTGQPLIMSEVLRQIETALASEGKLTPLKTIVAVLKRDTRVSYHPSAILKQLTKGAAAVPPLFYSEGKDRSQKKAWGLTKWKENGGRLVQPLGAETADA